MDGQPPPQFVPSELWSKLETSSHHWRRDTLDDEFKYVTSGRFHKLPQQKSKEVRIFLSSTFTDFYAERNSLIRKVYPRLKTICKEKYELDFQVSLWYYWLTLQHAFNNALKQVISFGVGGKSFSKIFRDSFIQTFIHHSVDFPPNSKLQTWHKS